MSKNNLETITLNQKGITDFGKARNELLKKAKADWVLFLDTDEKLSKELETEILEVVKNPKGYSGFYLKRKIYFCSEIIGEDKVLRLARKNAGRWERAVHETWNIKGKTRTLNGYIIHRTAENLHEYIDKINSYSTIHANENIKEGKSSNILKIIFYPKLKFLENFLKGRGVVFSLMQTLHSFLAWSKQWKLQNA